MLQVYYWSKQHVDDESREFQYIGFSRNTMKCNKALSIFLIHPSENFFCVEFWEMSFTPGQSGLMTDIKVPLNLLSFC